MKVIYGLLAYLLVFASCAKTDYAENGVDRKDITGYTEIGFYSLDGVCIFAEQEQVQTAINSKRLTYRLQNSDQSQYIHVCLLYTSNRVASAPFAGASMVSTTFTSGISCSLPI